MGESATVPAPAKPRLVLCLTPTLGMVSMWWHNCMRNLIWPMNIMRGEMPMIDSVGGKIGQIRNALIARCFETEIQRNVVIDSVFWVDDDVLVLPAALITLLAHEADIAAGVYFSKGDPSWPLIFPGPSAGTTRFRPGEVFPSWGYAQGMSVVKFDVYRRMIAELNLPKDENGNYEFYKQPGLQVDDHGGITVGGTEDFHFFHLAHKLGIVPIVDCTKHAFAFHYDAATKKAFPAEQWAQWGKAEPIVWKTPSGDVKWE